MDIEDLWSVWNVECEVGNGECKARRANNQVPLVNDKFLEHRSNREVLPQVD